MRTRFQSSIKAGTAFTLTLLLSTWASEASACPNCKEAIAAQPSENGEVANGYNWSVLFMMTMPFSLLGTGAFFVKRAVDRGVFPEL